MTTVGAGLLLAAVRKPLSRATTRTVPVVPSISTIAWSPRLLRSCWVAVREDAFAARREIAPLLVADEPCRAS